MKRRDFLRSMAVMPILGRSILATSPILAGVKKAYAANGKTLVVIFQRGGCDGLNSVVPYGEDEYYNLRPDIAIAAPGSGSGAAIDLDGFFGLHPAMSEMHEIYQRGDLAILPAVHYSNANRSHFSSQDFIESGVPNQKLDDGWLNRYLSGIELGADLGAVSFSGLSHALRGNTPVVAINKLSSIADQNSAYYQNTLLNIYNQHSNNENVARSLLHKHGRLSLTSINQLERYSTSQYTVENDAVYPDSLYGQQLKDIAQLIKSGVGLEVAMVSSNGWDNHANQGGAQGNQATNLLDFSAGIAALYKDLGPAYMSDVIIMTQSEFGRTVKQNASLGTDHGNASSWFVIGGQINGGIYGEWPGLMPDQLYLNRYLAHTIDFTDIYAELLTKHLGAGAYLSSLLPGSQYSPIGFLS